MSSTRGVPCAAIQCHARRMVTDAEMTLLRWMLIYDLDEEGEAHLRWSVLSLLRLDFLGQFFASWPFTKRMQGVIEAISSLGHDGLVEFWERDSYTVKDTDADRDSRRTAWRLWIETHHLPMSEVDRRLERLIPIWWASGWSGDDAEDFDWGTTSAGEALYDRWCTGEPPPEVQPYLASFGPPWFEVVRHGPDQVWYEGYDQAEAERVHQARPGSYPDLVRRSADWAIPPVGHEPSHRGAVDGT